MRIASICLLTLFFTQFVSSLTSKPFPDFIDQISEDYKGPLFTLSQDYPKNIIEEKKEWENINYKTHSNEYLLAVRNYIFDGMIESDWRPEQNQVRKWFHIPWMHTGKHPREGLRGMTRERDLAALELSSQQTRPLQNWAVGYYNVCGGYTIGKVWEDPNNPKPEFGCFPVGTVVIKTLFTEGSPDDIPDLEGSPEWEANINATMDHESIKTIKKLRLIQMDVAVRDSQADDDLGWIFGAFVYDKNAPGKNGWERMVPVGLMWGNHPENESYYNPDRPDYIKHRIGHNGRFNGPLDNPQSSCLSCHSTAQWPVVSMMVVHESDQNHDRWFRNIRSCETFDENTQSLDYSLQLMLSIQNYYQSLTTPTEDIVNPMVK